MLANNLRPIPAQLMAHVFLISNTSWNIFNFRAALIRALIRAGHRVTAVAPEDEYSDRVRSLGCGYKPIPMDNAGTNPGKDLVLLFRFRQLFRQEKADIILTYTVKPNVYGTLAAWTVGVPTICNVTGLGTAFLRRNWLATIVSALYRFALHRACHVFFQNADHYEQFATTRLTPVARSSLIPGSGVNTEYFSPCDQGYRERRETFRFLLFGRLMLDKGVGEYVEAARELRTRYPKSEFWLMGFVDVANRSAIKMKDIQAWNAEGTIQFIPATDDVRPAIAECDCVVLPSYTEGMPRSLLEAGAMGKPMIATDVPGCRDVVKNGETGFLVRPRDSRDLADKMARLLVMPAEDRARMGQKARRRMVEEFDERIVLKRYLENVRACLMP